MKTTPIRPHLISLLLGTLAVFMIPSGLLAQGQDPAPDPPILPGDHVTEKGQSGLWYCFNCSEGGGGLSLHM